MRTADVTMLGGSPLLPKQQELALSTALVRFAGGGWGSGKTRASCLALLVNCLRNPWTAAYGADRPFSLLIAPTHKVLADSAYREFRAVCPPELIIKEVKSPDWKLTLANGHNVHMRTVRGSLEGASAVGVVVDEVHLVPDEKVWLNYQARAREPRANCRMVLASGLPEAGWLQSVFGEHHKDPNRLSVFMSTEDNHYLPPEVLEQFRRSAPASMVRRYIEGKWQTAEDRVYYQFDPVAHMVKRPIDRRTPVSVGLDIGDQSACVFGQIVSRSVKDEYGRIRKEKGLHIVDEITPTNVSTEEVCRMIRDRGWVINADSAIFPDSTIRRDEIAAIRKVFPNISLIKRSRKGNSDLVETGHLCINSAFCDADKNIRLTFSADLSREPGSLYHSVLNFKRASTGKIWRDNKIDHKCDAIRYLVQGVLPSTRSGIEVRQRP